MFKTLNTILFTFLCFAFVACDKSPHPYGIEQAQLNERIKHHFPRTRALDQAKKYKLTLSNPTLRLIAKPNTPGHVELNVDLKLARKGVPLSLNGHASFTGQVRYDAKVHTFWADHLQLKSFDVPLLSTILSKDEQRRITTKINTTLTLFWPGVPLYTLSTSPKERLARALLSDVQIKQGRLLLIF